MSKMVLLGQREDLRGGGGSPLGHMTMLCHMTQLLQLLGVRGEENFETFPAASCPHHRVWVSVWVGSPAGMSPGSSRSSSSSLLSSSCCSYPLPPPNNSGPRCRLTALYTRGAHPGVP